MLSDNPFTRYPDFRGIPGCFLHLLSSEGGFGHRVRVSRVVCCGDEELFQRDHWEVFWPFARMTEHILSDPYDSQS